MAFQKTRTARFSERELERIEQFLKQNPFLDFSTLVRVAVSSFIENPSLVVKPLTQKKPVSLKEKGGKVNGVHRTL